MIAIECDDIKFETKRIVRDSNYGSVCSQVSKPIRATIFSRLHEDMYIVIHMVTDELVEELDPDGGAYAIVTRKER